MASPIGASNLISSLTKGSSDPLEWLGLGPIVRVCILPVHYHERHVTSVFLEGFKYLLYETRNATLRSPRTVTVPSAFGFILLLPSWSILSRKKSEDLTNSNFVFPLRTKTRRMFLKALLLILRQNQKIIFFNPNWWFQQEIGRILFNKSRGNFGPHSEITGFD